MAPQLSRLQCYSFATYWAWFQFNPPVERKRKGKRNLFNSPRLPRLRLAVTEGGLVAATGFEPVTKGLWEFKSTRRRPLVSFPRQSIVMNKWLVKYWVGGYQIITFWRLVCGISVRFIISLRPNDKQKVGKTGWQTWYNDSRQHAGLDVFRI